MRAESFLIKKFFTTIKGSYLEAFLGLWKASDDPENCAYVKLAERKFYEEQAADLIEQMREIIKEYDRER